MTCVRTCGFTIAWGGLFSPFCATFPVTAAGGGSLGAAEVTVGVAGAPVGSRAVSTQPGGTETKHRLITIATTTTTAAQTSDAKWYLSNVWGEDYLPITTKKYMFLTQKLSYNIRILKTLKYGLLIWRVCNGIHRHCMDEIKWHNLTEVLWRKEIMLERYEGWVTLHDFILWNTTLRNIPLSLGV